MAIVSIQIIGIYLPTLLPSIFRSINRYLSYRLVFKCAFSVYISTVIGRYCEYAVERFVAEGKGGTVENSLNRLVFRFICAGEKPSQLYRMK